MHYTSLLSLSLLIYYLLLSNDSKVTEHDQKCRTLSDHLYFLSEIREVCYTYSDKKDEMTFKVEQGHNSTGHITEVSLSVSGL